MRSGITLQALRRHQWSLLGPACTQALAAGVISVMVMTARSIDRSPLTALERAALRAADIPDAITVFIGISIYLSIGIGGITMGLAASRQLRDIALLRIIGATPGQVRRSMALQAAVVAVPATLVGWAAAVPAGALWVAAMRSHGLVPEAVRFLPDPVAAPIALGIGLATSVVGASVAAVRTSRLAPRLALTEVTRGRRPIGGVRIGLGLLLVVGGVALSVALSAFAPDQASDAAVFVMLAECVGVGLLGPLLLRLVAAAVRPALSGGLGRVAVDDVGAMARSLSGALVPVVLAAGFALVKIATHTTSARVAGVPDPAADLWLDYCGTAVYSGFAGVAALNCFVTVLAGRRPDLAAMQLAGASRGDLARLVWIQTFVVSTTAVLLATGVAGATLVPILHAELGRWLPYVPPTVLAAGVLLVGGVVAAGMVGPVTCGTRRPPTEVVEVAA